MAHGAFPRARLPNSRSFAPAAYEVLSDDKKRDIYNSHADVVAVKGVIEYLSANRLKSSIIITALIYALVTYIEHTPPPVADKSV